MMNDIIWGTIPTLEGRYEVSTMGLIRHKHSKKLRRLIVDKDGYLKFSYQKSPNHFSYMRVNRAVALTFISNPENKLEVNHINGVKIDNNINNLEWATRRENTRHSLEVLKHWPDNRGEKCGTSKLTSSQVLEIRRKYKPRVYSQFRLAREYGVSRSAIELIVHNVNWAHL